MDMREVITPRSDQLNADDLLAGPMTIRITGVSIKGGQEQPVAISYENDNGKPYKACKSMCRVLVAAWGADSAKYVGRSITLYCDPKVKWGGMDVGGIRISHMTDLDAPMTMALTMTRGNKKPYTVKPLEVAKSIDHAATLSSAATLAELQTAWAAIPKAEQPKHAATKDARKTALSKPVDPSATPPDDFIAGMESVERAV